MKRDWPLQAPRELEAYDRRKDKLSVQRGVLFWGTRIIIPPKGRHTLLDELHETHLGIVKIKTVARSYLRWPGLDTEIEMRVKDCAIGTYVRQQTATGGTTASVGMARSDVAQRTH